MRIIYLHLLLLLASPCAIGQISLSGTLHQYEGSRIAIGKAASCIIRL